MPPPPLSLLPLALLLAAPTAAQLTIYNETAGTPYRYAGCYNETVDIAGSANNRALPDGTHQVAVGTMTVPQCLAFCSFNGTTYKYAGVEYSRECWCGNRISALSVRGDDALCDTPCDGNQTMACGGPLKLSVYQVSEASSGLVISGVGLAAMGAMALYGFL